MSNTDSNDEITTANNYVEDEYPYYPYSVHWSSKTPKSFKVSYNYKREKRKENIWKINQLLKNI